MMTDLRTDEKQHQNPDKIGFGKVFYDELIWIERRRLQLQKEGLDPSVSETSALPVDLCDIDKLAELQGKALGKNLCGLAISGGGIRSATFALGVLQGLASLNLLPRFDYLSTVSGGGYIGSWFSAWVNRDGFKEVVTKKLVPPRMQDHPQTCADGSFEVESETIRHLRLYSNYLAPRPGLFSFDGWALIAIYLRNLLLNQLILLFAILAMFATVRAIIELFSIYHDKLTERQFSVSEFILAIACLVVGVCGISLFAPSRDFADSPSSPKKTTPPFNLFFFWMCCIVPWVLVSVCASLLFLNSDALHWFNPDNFLINCAIGSSVFAIIHALLGYLATSSPWIGLRRAFVSGLIGGVLFFLAWSLLLSMAKASDPDGIPVAVIATFGVPLCLAEFVLINFLMIGLCGAELQELEREWWSSLNSRFMMVGVGWLLVFGTVIFSPWIIAQWWGSHPVSAGAAGASWLGLLTAGIKLAQGPGTGSPNQTGPKEAVVSLAPPLFLMTLVVAVSVLATWGCYDSYAYFVVRPDWTFQNRLPYLLTDLNAAKADVFYIHVLWWLFIAAGVLALLSHGVGHFVGVNTFSLQNMYANRLVRCYLGASQRNRMPNPLINLAVNDDIPISELYPGMEFQKEYLASQKTQVIAEEKEQSQRTESLEVEQQSISGTEAENHQGPECHGPLHLINGALNQTASTIHNSRSVKATRIKTGEEAEAEGLQFLERKAESFLFSPLYCGSEATGYCPAFAFAENVKLGAAVAVSGAAVSPNMGYHSSPAITALLTVFNVRLGAWFGNPGRDSRRIANPAANVKLLLSELTGMTSSETDYVYVSDGGHFENMGVYELIRRRCRFILAIDAGADPKFNENVGRIVRQVRIDFGIWIEVDIAPASPDASGRCESHMIVGRIRYDDVHKPAIKSTDPYTDDPNFRYEQNQGIIVWMKNSLTGDEPGDLVNYAAMNPNFPYDSTLNQFFNESQFESYRALGIHATLKSLSMAKSRIDKHDSTKEIFESIHDFWLTRPPNFVPTYTAQNDAYADIQKQLREDHTLSMLSQELYGTVAQKQASKDAVASSSPEEQLAERLMANEMFTALENVWLGLDLERQSKQPVYQGWMEVFRNWTHSERLKRSWENGVRKEFSPAFVRFIDLMMDKESST